MQDEKLLATIAVSPDDPAVADWLRERGWSVGRGPGYIAQLRKHLFVGSPRSEELAVLTSPAARKLRALTLEIDGGQPDDLLRNLPSELRALSLWAHGGLYPGTTL